MRRPDGLTFPSQTDRSAAPRSAQSGGKAINARRRPAEERGLLVSGGACRKTLAGIPQDGIAAPALLHREIALEHAPAGAKLLYANLERRAATPRRSPPRRAAVRSSRALLGAAEPEAPPASRGHCRDRRAPSCPRAIRQRPPPRTPAFGPPKIGLPKWFRTIGVCGKVRGQRRNLAQLRMVNPGIESETEPGQTLEALTEPLLREYPRTRHGLVHAFIRIPRRRKADCVKAPAAGGEMGLEDRLDP